MSKKNITIAGIALILLIAIGMTIVLDNVGPNRGPVSLKANELQTLALKNVKNVENVNYLKNVENLKNVNYLKNAENLKNVEYLNNLKNVEDLNNENLKNVEDLNNENLKNVEDLNHAGVLRSLLAASAEADTLAESSEQNTLRLELVEAPGELALVNGLREEVGQLYLNV